MVPDLISCIHIISRANAPAPLIVYIGTKYILQYSIVQQFFLSERA